MYLSPPKRNDVALIEKRLNTFLSYRSLKLGIGRIIGLEQSAPNG